MAVLTQAEVDCLIAELDPHVGTEEDREAIGRIALAKYLTEIPQFGENYCPDGVTDNNVVLQSDVAINVARKTIGHFVKLINVASDSEKLAEFQMKYAKRKARKLMAKELFVTGEPVVIEFYRSLFKNPENQAAIERLMKHTFQVIRSNFEEN
ncbi:unnamed protein product [Dicrocoelium dendriticum]|nr:unnamed protein product [Dicrocoelium dendriticum]